MAKTSNKINLQKLVLNELANKKAVSLDDLTTKLDKEIPKKDRGKTKLEYSIKRAVTTMEKKGYIEVIPSAQSDFLKITSIGRHKLAQLYLSSPDHIVPTTWDGKWRIVILDVPENDKQTRNALRYILKKANFLCLKNSVWISPYSFEQFLYNMKENLDLQNEMVIMVTDYLDPRTQEFVKKRFLEEIEK